MTDQEATAAQAPPSDQQPEGAQGNQQAQQKKKKELSEETKRAIKLCQEGNALFADKNFDGAIECYEKAIKEDPEYPESYFNLGVSYRDLERNEEALKAFQTVTEKQKLSPKALNNIGLLMCRMERWEEAEDHYRKSIDQHFQYALAHFNLGMMLCRQGRYEEGFKECEWRWQTPEFTPIRCIQPRWTGQSFDGTLLAHTEQGIGDTIQFMRFLPEIKRRCKRVILFCPENLHCLFDESKGVDDLRTPGNLDLGEFQFYLPLMSAPYALGTTLDNLPAEIPYLHPEKREVNLGECHVPGAKLKVGICWGGSVTHAYDQHRSCKLADLGPLLDVPGVAFYSLLKGPQEEELSQLSPEHAAKVRNTADLQKDMADAAAIVEQLDLVISVDTSVIHLVGAMGKPGWLLLAVNGDWRWMEDRDDSPWYPTLKIHRQNKLDDWAELMSRVAEALNAEVAQRG